MLGNLKFLVSMVFFTVLYITTVAPALESVSADIKGVGGPGTVAIIETVETALFIGLPLVFVGGIIVIAFVSATGIRGTSR